MIGDASWPLSMETLADAVGDPFSLAPCGQLALGEDGFDAQMTNSK